MFQWHIHYFELKLLKKWPMKRDALSLLSVGRCWAVDVRQGESLAHLEMNSVVGVGSEVSEERDCRENIRTGAGLPLTLRGASQQGAAKLEGLTTGGSQVVPLCPVLAGSAAVVQPWRRMGVPGSGWRSTAAKGHVWLELEIVATLALWAVDHAFWQEDHAEDPWQLWGL